MGRNEVKGGGSKRWAGWLDPKWVVCRVRKEHVKTAL